jgi:hypothetical protein
MILTKSSLVGLLQRKQILKHDLIRSEVCMTALTKRCTHSILLLARSEGRKHSWQEIKVDLFGNLPKGRQLFAARHPGLQPCLKDTLRLAETCFRNRNKILIFVAIELKSIIFRYWGAFLCKSRTNMLEFTSNYNLVVSLNFQPQLLLSTSPHGLRLLWHGF